MVESAFSGVEIHVRGNEIAITGDEADKVGHLFEELVLLLERGQRLEPATWCAPSTWQGHDERLSEVLTAEVLRLARGRTIRPKSAGRSATSTPSART